ncbi:hypothetical protein [Cellulomonas olei]|uniref:hypothetical protein n=1 Tax=Cellulomonas sp. P4 TaxID=3142533 RepID=UPI0031B9CFC9
MSEHYVVEIEYDTRADITAELSDLLADHHPHPHRAPDGRAEVFVTITADDLPAALRATADLLARSSPAVALAVHVLPGEEFDRRHPSTPGRHGTHTEGR